MFRYNSTVVDNDDDVCEIRALPTLRQPMFPPRMTATDACEGESPSTSVVNPDDNFAPLGLGKTAALHSLMRKSAVPTSTKAANMRPMQWTGSSLSSSLTPGYIVSKADLTKLILAAGDLEILGVSPELQVIAREIRDEPVECPETAEGVELVASPKSDGTYGYYAARWDYLENSKDFGNLEKVNFYDFEPFENYKDVKSRQAYLGKIVKQARSFILDKVLQREFFLETNRFHAVVLPLASRKPCQGRSGDG